MVMLNFSFYGSSFIIVVVLSKKLDLIISVDTLFHHSDSSLVNFSGLSRTRVQGSSAS